MLSSCTILLEYNYFLGVALLFPCFLIISQVDLCYFFLEKIELVQSNWLFLYMVLHSTLCNRMFSSGYIELMKIGGFFFLMLQDKI